MAWDTSVQSYIKFGARKYLFQGSKYGYTADFRLGTFRRISLTLSHFVNAITSWILGVILCMSAILEHKDCRTEWNTPCPCYSSGEVVEVFLISLCVQSQTEFRQFLSS
jgi:hypothetical protein